MKGMIVTSGTYAYNAADKTLTTKIVGGSFPNIFGMSRKARGHVAHRRGAEMRKPADDDGSVGERGVEASEVTQGIE